MPRARTILKSILGVAGLCLMASTAVAESYPEKPIKWIVPYNPGGGTDSTARIVQSYIEEHDLLPQPFAMVNLAGAGGSIGARQAKDEPADGYTILIHQSALLIRDANGMSDFGYKDFEPIISLNRQCMLPAVRNDSEYGSYEELMAAAQSDPGAIVWGGNIGSSNHMAIAVMEAASPGSDFKKVQVGGGAESYAALKGNIINVGNFGIGEILAFSADIRPLALLADERDETIPDVPTAKELGADAVYCNEHNLYAPKGTSPERIAVLAAAFETALSSEDVRTAFRDKLGASTKIRAGDALAGHLASELERLRPMAEKMAEK